jgi:hypothetical protein
MSETQKIFHYNINSIINIRVRVGVPSPKKMDPTGSNEQSKLWLIAAVVRIRSRLCHLYKYYCHVWFFLFWIYTNMWCIRSTCVYRRENSLVQQKLVETNWWKSGSVPPLRLRVHFNVQTILFRICRMSMLLNLE